MANNRLYLVDTEEKQFIMIAKGWGCGWSLGNVDQLEEFLRTLYQDGDYKPTCLVIGTENDREFYDKHIEGATNFNIKSGWKYYEPDEQNKADAALIAAAPEMYKALVLAYMNPHNGYIDAVCKAISKAEGRDNAFVNWFIVRRHARDFPEGDVNIPTAKGGLLKVSYAEIMERAAIWDSIFEPSKAEQSQNVPSQTETK